MKKLVLITLLLSPMASLAGDYKVVANPEQIYQALDVEEKVDSRELGKTIYYKNGGEFFCTRIATLDAGGTNDYHCFHLTEADLAR